MTDNTQPQVESPDDDVYWSYELEAGEPVGIGFASVEDALDHAELAFFEECDCNCEEDSHEETVKVYRCRPSEDDYEQKVIIGEVQTFTLTWERLL